jgi:Holliday junction resolvase
MNSEHEFALKLASSLRGHLDPNLEVLSSPFMAPTEGLSSGSLPDLVITGGPNVRPVIIEIKGSKGQDLPLKTAQVTKVLYQANSFRDPRIALVTPSRVGTIVRRELEDQNVKVFNSDDYEELVRQLASYITEVSR